VDTSTKIFIVWKSFGWIFWRSSIQNSHASLCQVPRKLMPRKQCNFLPDSRQLSVRLIMAQSSTEVEATTDCDGLCEPLC